MTRELAVEYARRGIRADVLCPGPIETPLMAELMADPQWAARRLVHIPMGRPGQAPEIACRAVPGLRRFFVHDRDDARRRRRHHRRLRDTGIGREHDGAARWGSSDLREHIGAGDVDTVLVAFPDLQGRLMGKRVTGHYFLDPSSTVRASRRATTSSRWTSR